MQMGEWTIACDANPATGAARQQVFRSRAQVFQPGWHNWETNWRASQSHNDVNDADWRDTGLICETTILPRQ